MVTGPIEKVMDGKYLSYSEFCNFVDKMRGGEVTDQQFVAFLAALETRNRLKGINPEECVNFIRALRLKRMNHLEGTLCNASTGGDRYKTINVGTPASLVISAAGVDVLKIGSRGITSKCGSREILEQWGVDPFQLFEKIVCGVKEIGIGYFDFERLVPISARAGVRSPLHYIGPLCNPANLTYKVLGCSNKSHLETIEPILDRSCPNFLLTYNPNIDEISLADLTEVVEKRNGERREYIFDPEKEGLPHVEYSEIAHPGNPTEGAKIVLEALSGERGPARDIIAVNAGAGIYLAGKVNSIREGYCLSQDLIERGMPVKKLEDWRKFQNG